MGSCWYKMQQPPSRLPKTNNDCTLPRVCGVSVSKQPTLFRRARQVWEVSFPPAALCGRRGAQPSAARSSAGSMGRVAQPSAVRKSCRSGNRPSEGHLMRADVSPLVPEAFPPPPTRQTDRQTDIQTTLSISIDMLLSKRCCGDI